MSGTQPFDRPQAAAGKGGLVIRRDSHGYVALDRSVKDIDTVFGMKAVTGLQATK